MSCFLAGLPNFGVGALDTKCDADNELQPQDMFYHRLVGSELPGSYLGPREARLQLRGLRSTFWQAQPPNVHSQH